jgi:hypothetical protein
MKYFIHLLRLLPLLCVVCVSGCIHAVDPAAAKVVPRRCALEAFAGEYGAVPLSISKAEGAAKNTRDIQGFLKDFTTVAAVAEGPVSFEVAVGERLTVVLRYVDGKTQTLHYEKNKDYTFADGVLRFTPKTDSGVIGDVAVGSSQKTMNWMLDEQGRLTIIFGGRVVGAVFYIIPIGAVGEGMAVFERR